MSMANRYLPVKMYNLNNKDSLKYYINKDADMVYREMLTPSKFRVKPVTIRLKAGYTGVPVNIATIKVDGANKEINIPRTLYKTFYPKKDIKNKVILRKDNDSSNDSLDNLLMLNVKDVYSTMYNKRGTATTKETYDKLIEYIRVRLDSDVKEKICLKEICRVFNIKHATLLNSIFPTIKTKYGMPDLIKRLGENNKQYKADYKTVLRKFDYKNKLIVSFVDKELGFTYTGIYLCDEGNFIWRRSDINLIRNIKMTDDMLFNIVDEVNKRIKIGFDNSEINGGEESKYGEIRFSLVGDTQFKESVSNILSK